MDQDEINALLVERGRAGHDGRAAEGRRPVRVRARRRRGRGAAPPPASPFEVVPGITSAIAAPAYAGIPVTHRGLSTHVTVVTGHEDPAKGTTDTDWDALARAGGTLVVLMGAGHLADIAARARSRAGVRPSTPVAAVRWGTRPEQRTIRATLATIADAGVRVAERDRRRRGRRRSTSRGSSAGRCSAAASSITRAREQASELRARLEQLGAEVIELPSIALEPIDFALPDARPATRGSCSRRPTGSTRSSTAASRRAGLDARALAPAAGRGDRPGHRRRARAARHPRRPRARAVRRRVAARGVPRPERRGPSRGCCSPGPSRRATCCPKGSSATRLRGRRARRCTAPCAPMPDARRARAGARRRGRRDHVHVVVDGRAASATSSARCPTRSRWSSRSARSRRRPRSSGACASTSRPIRTPSTASSTRCSPRSRRDAAELGQTRRPQVALRHGIPGAPVAAAAPHRSRCAA